MSTNTTSTSDRVEADAPSSAPVPDHTGQGYENPFAATGAFPDPAVIASLANEFFAALPRVPLSEIASRPPSTADPKVDADVPGVSDSAAVSPFVTEASFSPPNGMYSYPGVPTGIEKAQSVEGNPSAPPASPTGPLTEADLRAIPASLAGSTALVRGAPATVPPSPVPVAPTYFPDGLKTAPPAALPTFPSASETFSFPSVPAMPSSPPTAPPSGADVGAIPVSAAGATAVPGSSPHFLSGEKGSPTASEPVFPPVNEVFSFPRVPAMAGGPGVQSAPSISAPAASSTVPPSSASSGTTAPDGRFTPESAATATPRVPQPPTYTSDAGNSVYPGAPTAFPSPSELFSFPGVPGVQSAPGLPAPPASPPPVPANQADAQASVPNATVPGTSGYLPVRETAAPTTETQRETRSTTLPSGVESFEFRPDVVPDLGVPKRPLDPRLIRQDFPILQEQVHGRPLIWLDNAATTQKPNAVIDRLSAFYRHENSNIHRAAHTLAARATDAYESAREKCRRFLNASSTREIIFVRGTTEGINLVAQSWGRRHVEKDDEVVITWLEHHANIVPWQMLCSEKGARLRVAPVNDRGEIILEEYERLLGPKTKIVSFSQVSNALGTITPAREMVEMAHRYGARVLVDGAQAVSHMPVDVQGLNCDFYVFSGHKVFAPTGIGVVYGKFDVLENTPPWQGGGNMIVDVSFERTTYQGPPARFEAGTGNIADAVGLGAALDYVQQIGMESIAAYEHELLNYATSGLLTVPGLRLIGTAREKAGVLSFVLDDVRNEDVGVALNQEGIAVRAGHHCAQPILRRMGVEGTVRPSLALYNTNEDIDALVAALLRLQAGRGHH